MNIPPHSKPTDNIIFNGVNFEVISLKLGKRQPSPFRHSTQSTNERNEDERKVVLIYKISKVKYKLMSSDGGKALLYSKRRKNKKNLFPIPI